MSYADLSWDVFRDKETPQAELDQALSQLPERYATVIRLNYGLAGDKITMNDIGRQWGVTRNVVNQMRCKALRRLRYILRHREESHD
jgi:DNA-directed RNA polymerase sigma subunit (sigma70/sigma32)